MFCSLPLDVIEYLFHRFPPALPPQDLGALALTSKAVNALVTPLLYQRVSFTIRCKDGPFDLNETFSFSADTTCVVAPGWLGDLGAVPIVNGISGTSIEAKEKVNGLESEKRKWTLVRAQMTFFRTLAARPDLAAMVLDFEWEVLPECTERQLIALVRSHFPLLTRATGVHLIMHKAFETFLTPESAATHGLVEIEATQPMASGMGGPGGSPHPAIDGPWIPGVPNPTAPTTTAHQASPPAEDGPAPASTTARPPLRLFPALTSLHLSHHAPSLTLLKTLLLAPPHCASPISTQLHSLHLDSSHLNPSFVGSAHWLSTIPLPALTAFTITFPAPDYEGTAVGVSMKVANLLKAFAPTLEELTIGLRTQKRRNQWMMIEGGLEGIWEAPMIERSLVEQFVKLLGPAHRDLGVTPFPHLRVLTVMGVRRAAEALWDPLKDLVPSLRLDYRTLVVEQD